MIKSPPVAKARSSADLGPAIVDTTPECIKIVAIDGSLLQINPAGLAMIEADSEEAVLGQSIYSVVAPEHREAFRAFNERICRGESGTMTFEIIGRRGTHRTVETHATPFRTSDGQLVHLAITRDITPRLRAENDLLLLTTAAERQKRFYEAVLSATPDLVYVFGLDHRFKYANKALLEMWGRSWQDAIGKNCLELGYEPWHAAMHDREIDEVIATKKPVRGEVPFSGTAGRRTYDYIFVPVFGSDRQVEAVAGTTRDITERKDSEEAILRQAKELEQFAYVSSHDLQEPLRKVATYSDLLHSRFAASLPAEALALLDKMRQSADRMQALIKDLLEYSHLNRNEHRREPVDMNVVAARVLEDLESVITRRKATVSVDPLPIVTGDPVQLQQVLLNLVSNGLKFVRDAVPQIDISVRQEGENWLFSVCDNGIGIEAIYRDRIFGLFQRLHPRSLYEGTGIGLAICKRVVENAGGSIWVESEPGAGSTFCFTLPKDAA